MSEAVSRARRALARILAVAHKELLQLVRDRLSLGFIVGIPSLQLLLFGYAINLDVRHVPTAIVDQAQSALSRELVGELAATQTFAPIAAPLSVQEALRMLGASDVGAVVVIAGVVAVRTVGTTRAAAGADTVTEGVVAVRVMGNVEL